MHATNVVKQGLHIHGIPVIEADIPYINSVMTTIQQAQTPLVKQQGLHEEVPLVIVDPDVIQFD